MATTTETIHSQSSAKVTAATDSADYIPRGPVQATLNFYAPPTDGSKPHNYVEEPPAGQPQRNFGDTELPIQLNDIRGRESDFSLDTNAFAALRVDSTPTTTATTTTTPKADFTSDTTIRQTYYPQNEHLPLTHLPGTPTRILIFYHTIPRTAPSATRSPVNRVHIDQTPASAQARVRTHLPDPAEAAAALTTGRVRLINVWRPLNGAVQSHPLAFADSATVPDSALVGIEHRYPDRTGETAAVQYTPGQNWWYWSGMGDDERLLLQCYDSGEISKEGRGGLGRHGSRVPHSAFVDPRTPVGARGRESIEVRALVFG